MFNFNCRAELYRLENDATMAIVNYSQVTMIKYTTGSYKSLLCVSQTAKVVPLIASRLPNEEVNFEPCIKLCVDYFSQVSIHFSIVLTLKLSKCGDCVSGDQVKSSRC